MNVDVVTAISAEQPCGPDPDVNPELQNFLAVAEGQLPASYRDFNRKTFDVKETLKKLEEYFAVSRDVRFLVMLAKFNILSDNIGEFASCIDVMNKLSEAHWDHFHPTEAAGGNALRSAYLKSLDDLPNSVLPFQNATILNDKRIGAISLRSIMLADGKVPPRSGETAPDAGSIRDAFMRLEPVEQLVALRSQFEGIGANLDAIRGRFIEKAGYDTAPEFDVLPENIKNLTSYLTDVLSQRMPQEVAAPSDDADSETADIAGQDSASNSSAAPAGDIRSFREASAALEAILSYYAMREPSSPARLMIKQAHQLVGKSFIEAMRILAPQVAETSSVKLGGESPFSLDFTQLSALAEEGDQLAYGDDHGEPQTFNVTTRSAATALMRKVEIFYKSAEPSSPIPVLVERARNFVAKDFTSLLKEMAKKNDDNY